MNKILFAALIFASAYILLAQEGGFKTQTRQVNRRTSVIIEPAHSETFYQPKPNPPAPEKANIIVVPGYNPLPPSMSQNGGVVTVQQYQGPPPAMSRTVPTTPVAAENPPVLSNRTLPQSYGQPQRMSRSGEQQRLVIIAENPTNPTYPKKKEKPPIKLHLTERSVSGRTPPPQ
jgi:hypothetical protein